MLEKICKKCLFLGELCAFAGKDSSLSGKFIIKQMDFPAKAQSSLRFFYY